MFSILRPPFLAAFFWHGCCSTSSKSKNMQIAISKQNLKVLIEVLEHRQGKNEDISDIIEIHLLSESDEQLKADKVKFWARSKYAECRQHFLGTN